MKYPLLAAGLLATSAVAETPVLTVYTYDSFVSDWGPGPAVEAAFEDVCACDLQLPALGQQQKVSVREQQRTVLHAMLAPNFLSGSGPRQQTISQCRRIGLRWCGQHRLPCKPWPQGYRRRR